MTRSVLTLVIRLLRYSTKLGMVSKNDAGIQVEGSYHYRVRKDPMGQVAPRLELRVGGRFTQTARPVLLTCYCGFQSPRDLIKRRLSQVAMLQRGHI